MAVRPPAKPPVFRLLPVVGLGLFPAAAWAAPPAAEPAAAVSVYNRGVEATQPTGSRAAPASDQGVQAERIVASAQAVLERAETVSLKLVQKARIGDRVLTGSGRYVQMGQGEEQRFRFDCVLKCDTEPLELCEISDGLYFWAHQRTGDDPPALQRVEIRRVRERLEALGVADPSSTARHLGGLQRTIAQIRRWFTFHAAVADDEAGSPGWIVDGRVNAAHLAELVPELKPLAERTEGLGPRDLPDGVPWQVRLLVGRGDLVLRRIEWLGIPGARPVADSPPETIAVLELNDIVLDGPVDATAFFYQPATEQLQDTTEQFIAGMQPLP